MRRRTGFRPNVSFSHNRPIDPDHESKPVRRREPACAILLGQFAPIWGRRITHNKENPCLQ